MFVGRHRTRVRLAVESSSVVRRSDVSGKLPTSRLSPAGTESVLCGDDGDGDGPSSPRATAAEINTDVQPPSRGVPEIPDNPRETQGDMEHVFMESVLWARGVRSVSDDSSSSDVPQGINTRPQRKHATVNSGAESCERWGLWPSTHGGTLRLFMLEGDKLK